jgi:hypothetical protein
MYLIKGKYYERKFSLYNFFDISLFSPFSVWNILFSTLLLGVTWGREVEFHSPIKQRQIYVNVGHTRSGRKISIHFVHFWILNFKSSRNNADSVVCCTAIFSHTLRNNWRINHTVRRAFSFPLISNRVLCHQTSCHTASTSRSSSNSLPAELHFRGGNRW